MKIYKMGSAAYKRQKETQRKQREAAERPVKPGKPGQKYLYPLLRDANGRRITDEH